MKSTKDLIHGEYYFCWLHQDNDMFFIIRNDRVSDSERLWGFMLSNMNDKSIFRFQIGGGCLFNSDRSFRVATYEERVWLDACIQQDRFVPKSECKFEPNYEIY